MKDEGKYKNLFEYATLGDTVFVRPLTYMNDSGKTVREALKKFAPPSLIPHPSFPFLVVLHDDGDIAIGDFKISFARNSAGHKGAQSIIDTLHTNRFFRARIGVRPQREMKGEAHRKKTGEFALKTITPNHRKILDGVFEKIGAEVTKN